MAVIKAIIMPLVTHATTTTITAMIGVMSVEMTGVTSVEMTGVTNREMIDTMNTGITDATGAIIISGLGDNSRI
ncbi:MAG: hypothetical protein HFG29_05930 [Eubacterium sp.]|nr:hypothetical protein [Eubacterium sp.]